MKGYREYLCPEETAEDKVVANLTSGGKEIAGHARADAVR